MANYKNNYRSSRGSYTPKKSNYNKSSGSGFLKTLGVVLLVFLVVGLIGSIFSRPAGSAEPDTTKPSAIESPTEAPELITFSTNANNDLQAEAGMTFAEWCDSDYVPLTPETSAPEYRINDGVFCHYSYGELFLDGMDSPVKGTDIITPGGNYHPA